jgi:hypothetical protein
MEQIKITLLAAALIVCCYATSAGAEMPEQWIKLGTAVTARQQIGLAQLIDSIVIILTLQLQATRASGDH